MIKNCQVQRKKKFLLEAAECAEILVLHSNNQKTSKYSKHKFLVIITFERQKQDHKNALARRSQLIVSIELSRNLIAASKKIHVFRRRRKFKIDCIFGSNFQFRIF